VNPWAFHPHPDVWALIAVIGIAYWWALRHMAPRELGRRERAPGRKVATFGAGLALMWAVSDWPVHDLAEDYLYSVHMVQHTLLSLAVPGLLLLGIPTWLQQRLVRPPVIRGFLQRAARPLVAAVVFNAVVAFSHWPAFVDATLRNELLHFAAHALLFAAAGLMWIPVVNRLPELPTMSYPTRMVYLFLQSVVPTVPASFLTFAEGPVYRFYASVPRPFAISVVEDQQLAGAIMKLGGGLILWGTIIVLFFRWYEGEQQAAKRRRAGVLTWDDVERELHATPPAPEPSRPNLRQ
jgi:putative membrane protein